jgi:hypothetical protein
MHLATILNQPGDVLTRPEVPPNREFVETLGGALDDLGWSGFDFMAARVRSRLGFVANISVMHETRRAYSDVEREHLSAVAQLASLALSGTAP